MAYFPKRQTFTAPLNELWHLVIYRYRSRPARFKGDAETICQHIVDACWNGTFYCTSLGNFNYFWIRDFAAVAKSLRMLGRRDYVHETVRWALQHYMAKDAVTLCITPRGRLFDSPTRGVDTLPSLIHCLWTAKYSLNEAEKRFLNQQVQEFCEDFIDADSGQLLPRPGFAELRDAVVYDRSAYAVAMVERLAYCCEKLGLNFPFSFKIYQDELLERYWNGDYFNADFSNNSFSIECALIPFILRSIEDTTMLNKTLDYIRDNKLAEPCPIKYTNTPEKFHYRLWARTVMRNYAGDTIWSWHGAYYLRLLWGQGRPEAGLHEQDFELMIKKYRTFPELLNSDGSMYNSLIYKSSEGMIWAAIFLTIKYYTYAAQTTPRVK